MQEVAARAFVRQAQFTSVNHLTRWSCRVAANLRVDQVRRGNRMADQPVPDWSDTTETARLVEGRVALEQVLSAVLQLSDADRVALFGEREEAADRREAVKLAVRRHRARARLAAMVEGMIAAFAVLNRALLRRGESPGLGEPVAISSVAAVALAMPMVAAWRDAPAATPVRQEQTSSTALAPSAATRANPAPEPAQPGARSSASGEPGVAVPAPQAPSRSVLSLKPGPDHGATVETVEPEKPQTVCLRGVLPTGDSCVDRPGPAIAPPPLLSD